MAVSDISTLQIKVETRGITQAVNALNKLGEAAEKTEQKVKKLGTQVLQTSGEIAGSTGATTALTTAILLLNSNLSRLTTQTLQQTQVQRQSTDAMRDAHAAARGLAGSLGALWVTYGNAAPMALGIAVGYSMKQILTQGAEFDDLLTNIQVKGNETTEVMGRARQSILNLGQGIYGPQQVAGALETLVLAGLKAEDAIAGLAPALNLATVGGTTIEKAAYTLVQVGTAMGYTSDSFGLIGDKIAKTAAVSMSSVESLSEAFKSASSVGVVYGVTLNDLGVQLAALSNLGIQGTAAGTAVKNFYKELDSDAKKVTGTLSKLGVSIDDLKIDGKFRSITDVMKVLGEAFQRAGDQGGKAMQNLSNERGMRNVAALYQLYQKELAKTGKGLQQLHDEIANSAGYTATSAAMIALTSKNQITSTFNTLKTSFVDTFSEMSPQVNVFANELKKIFGSDEFKGGLREMATSLGFFVVELVKAIPTIIELGKVLLVAKAAMMGFGLMKGVIAGITSVMTASTALTGVLAGTTSAATAMTVAFPVLGAVLAVAAAAWWLYGKNKDEALDTSKTDSAIATNDELITNLEKEAERLAVANKHLAENISLKKAAEQTSRELALSEMKARNATAEADAEKQFNAAYANIGNDNKYKNRIPELAKKNIMTLDGDVKKAVLAYQNWQNAVNNSVHSAERFEKAFAAVNAGSALNQKLTDAKLAKEAELAKERAKAIAAAFGNVDLTAPDKPKRDAHAEKIKGEALELDRLTASYLAKAEATEQYSTSGVLQMANTRQAIVDTNNKVKDYYTQEEYLMMRSKALKADEAKFEQQKTNMISDASAKVNDIINRGIVQRAAETMEGYKSMGMMEKLMAVTAMKTKMTQDETEAMKAKGREADKQLQYEAAIAKLNSATASSGQRAQNLIDEADAMVELGKSGKQTAIQLAEAQIEKLKLAKGSATTETALRMEAAALEDIAKAYNSMARISNAAAEYEAVNAAVTSELVIGSETAKVVAHEKATRAIIDSSIKRAEAALIVAKEGKDKEKIAEAQETYDKLIALSKKTDTILKKQFDIKIKVAGLKDVSNSFNDMAKSARSFGDHMSRVGDGLEGLAGGFQSLAEIREKQGISEQERLQGQLGAYGQLAEGAANFFGENSRGYAAMMAVSKVYHAAEMAMMMVRMGKLAIEAILNQGKGDPYTAFGRMAAMAAIVGALGFATGAFGSSGSGGKTAEEVQKEQGTGSVFGDVEAKSESISKSLDFLEKNSSVLLPVNQAMLASLRNIESSMSGLTNLVLRTDGVTNGTNMGIQTGKLAGNGMNFVQNTLMGTNALGGSIAGWILGGPLGAVLGSFVGKTLGKLWGSTKQNIVDSGLQFGGKVSDLQSGAGYDQYASVDTTKKSYFGLKKKTSNRIETQGLNSELSAQFGLIFTGLEETLKAAAPALNKSSLEVGKAIDSMVIQTTSVSLKDLKGEELQAAINGVVSKTMDEIAQQAFPAMDAFRQVGEGYAQTVIRVASGVEQANLAMEQLGINAVKYTDVIDKQGDVAVEIAKQSIGAKEGLSGINAMLQGMTGSLSELVDTYAELNAIRKSMNLMGLQGDKLNVNLVKGAGGISELTSALEAYQDSFFTDSEKSAIMLKSVGLEFKALGLKLPESKNALRDLITKVSAIGSEESDKLAGKLLVLADSYAKATEAAEEARLEQIDGLKSSLDAMKEFAQSIREFRESLLLGDLSNLTPEEKFAEAKAQYDSTLSKALAGDVTAQENMTGIAQAFLEASRVVNASSLGYDATFQQVQKDLQGLEDYANNQVSEIQRQIDALEKQTSLLESLNATANSILSGITGASTTPAGSIPVIMPEPVVVGNNDDVVEELRRQRDEAAAAAAATQKRLEDLAAVTLEAAKVVATTTVEGYVEAQREASWARKNYDMEQYER